MLMLKLPARTRANTPCFRLAPAWWRITSTTFYVELKPDRSDYLPEALAISGLSMDSLKEHGTAPQLRCRPLPIG